MSALPLLQKTQASNLLSVLQTEMNMEATRQQRLGRVKDPEERRRMEELYDVQREAARGRIEELRRKDGEIVKQRVRKIIRYKKKASKLSPEKSMQRNDAGAEGVTKVNMDAEVPQESAADASGEKRD